MFDDNACALIMAACVNCTTKNALNEFNLINNKNHGTKKIATPNQLTTIKKYMDVLGYEFDTIKYDNGWLNANSIDELTYLDANTLINIYKADCEILVM